MQIQPGKKFFVAVFNANNQPTAYAGFDSEKDAKEYAARTVATNKQGSADVHELRASCRLPAPEVEWR